MAQTKPRDHATAALRYARGVVDGTVIAGPYVVKAAQRHLNDLEREQDSNFPYCFRPELGARVCRFVELFPHIKGKWAKNNELLTLGDWQCFLVVVLFGWVRKDDGRRRFRTAYLRVPRKNAKSTLAAALGLYMLLADGEFGAEVYATATTEKQAWEVFKPAKLMLQRAEGVAAGLGAEVWAKSLIIPEDGSKFEPLIGDPGDGSSPSCAIIDEFHEHELPNQYDTMETGMGAREQPLMLVITTAGYNIAGPCYELDDRACKVLDGVVREDELFAVVHGIDIEKDDWADPKSLIKANPNYGVSIDPEWLLSQQRQAMQNPILQNRFKTKHLNIWCSVLRAWMNLQLWQLAGDPMLEEDELVGCESWIATDLASKLDLCSEQRLYRKYLNDRPHYYLFGSYWLPEAAIEEDGPNKAHYEKWVKRGLLTPTPGAVIDFDLITEHVVADAKRMNPLEVVFDPFNAILMANACLDAGVKNVVEFVQQPQAFAVPMDDLLAAVTDGRFHHDGNEITAWCMSNVVARPTKKGLFAPMKMKQHQKIDGAVAAIMAFARANAAQEREREYQMMTI